MIKNLLIIILICISTIHSFASDTIRYHLSNYGLVANSKQNASPLMASAIAEIKKEMKQNRTNKKVIKLTLDPGRYDFYPNNATSKEYYISNHDQDQPKIVGLAFEDMHHIYFDGQGSELIFHGRMLPLSLVGSSDCTFKNFHIDFETPQICQIKVLENDTLAETLTFETAPWVKYTIKEGAFYNVGEGWEILPTWAVAFEAKSKRLVYTTSDFSVGTKNVSELQPGIIKSNKWKNSKLIPGTIIALRSGKRPTPGIFITHSTNTVLENIQMHYAEGMGLLAQMSENILLDGFSVCLRNSSDPRYFTTQADATHFSACKGSIISKNGLYEGMMDDAINVHGTYLKVTKRLDNKRIIAQYMHGQSWGFEWGRPNDAVQFIDSKTMEIIGGTNSIVAIKAIDQPTSHGAKEFEITFSKPIDPAISETGVFGVENLEWTPEVVFANNTIRNNRARGTLFSTPKKTLIENNIFDHTSGTAILLCGDCNGWFETGACKDVTIRNNQFINALTNQFQFTNAIISIYPEIPDLKGQKKYFHSGIVIENNVFETFDKPIVYAKSVDGLIFRNNQIKRNTSYPAFHWNTSPFWFQRVINSSIKDNQIEGGFDFQRDVKIDISDHHKK